MRNWDNCPQKSEPKAALEIIADKHPNITLFNCSEGVTGVTGDTMGPLVRSHDDYRHPRTCKLSLIS